MTNEQAEALGRRAKAAGFRMGERILGVIGTLDARTDTGVLIHARMGSPLLPDFHDPATLGVLVAQVRERWGKPSLFGYPWGDRWTVSDGTDCGDPYPVIPRIDGDMMRDSEAEAWVAALEAAPKR